VQISAKFGAGIETLKAKVLQITGTADFGLHTPVAFTARQQDLLSQLTAVESNRQASSVISELLNGRLSRG
jgi:hypothetical protein